MSENKRYYWLKLKDNFFNTADIKIIRSRKNGAEYIIFWQQLLLLSISSTDIGILRYKENIPYTPELLSVVTDTNIDIVKGALILFEQLGMIELNGNGDIIIDGIIQEMIGSETSVAVRVRKHREKKEKMLHSNNLKQISNTEIDKETDKDKELDIDKEKKRKKFIVPSIEHITNYCCERNNKINPESFFDYYESKGWMIGKNKMKDWKAAIRTWERNSNKYDKSDKSNNSMTDHYNKVTESLKKEGWL